MAIAADLISRVLSTRSVPLYRTSYALMLTTAGNAVLGLLFWVAAARLYASDVVGLGAAGISALQLVAGIGWVGLQITLIRYLPIAGAKRRWLTAYAYVAGASVALVLAIVFTLALTGTLSVDFISENAATRVAFCMSVVVWVVFSLQDAALIGVRRSLVVPLENAIYALGRLVALVALAAIASPWTLMGVWVVAAALVAVPVNGLLFRSFLIDATVSRLVSTRRVVRFSAGQTGVALVAWIPDFLVPLLVLKYAGESANAYYYVAWMIGFSVRLVVLNMANALTVEGAYSEARFRDLIRSATRLSAIVLLPIVLFLVVAPSIPLQIFGADYAEAATFLRYFALSLIPFTFAAFVIANDRVRQRSAPALAITTAGSVVIIGLNIVLIPELGLDGAGIAWLVGHCVAAVVALVTLLVDVRPPTRWRGAGWEGNAPVV
jgi:O-antigen/teichoic acid export membrane protein